MVGESGIFTPDDVEFVQDVSCHATGCMNQGEHCEPGFEPCPVLHVCTGGRWCNFGWGVTS